MIFFILSCCFYTLANHWLAHQLLAQLKAIVSNSNKNNYNLLVLFKRSLLKSNIKENNKNTDESLYVHIYNIQPPYGKGIKL